VACLSFVPFVSLCSKNRWLGRLPLCSSKKPAKAHEYWLRSRLLELCGGREEDDREARLGSASGDVFLKPVGKPWKF
jgi:hypothetical protein